MGWRDTRSDPGAHHFWPVVRGYRLEANFPRLLHLRIDMDQVRKVPEVVVLEGTGPGSRRDEGGAVLYGGIIQVMGLKPSLANSHELYGRQAGIDNRRRNPAPRL